MSETKPATELGDANQGAFVDRSSILRASTNSYRQVEKCLYLLFLLLTDTVENRTLCRARALSKREAFVASGRGRRQAAEAGADLRSKYADSLRKAPAQYRCDVYRISAGLAQHQRIPQTAENRTLCRARALSKRLSDVEWGALSQWRSKRKAHPGIRIQTGT